MLKLLTSVDTPRGILPFTSLPRRKCSSVTVYLLWDAAKCLKEHRLSFGLVFRGFGPYQMTLLYIGTIYTFLSFGMSNLDVISAHEYTSSNANFAASVEPGNSELMARVDEITSLRSVGKATVPSLLGLEKRTNPFLRVDTSAEIRHNVGVLEESDTDAEAFGKVRKAKDTFRG